MWICMPTMMHPQSCKSSTKYTTTCLHSAEVETPPTSRQNYSYPGFLRRNLRELQSKEPPRGDRQALQPPPRSRRDLVVASSWLWLEPEGWHTPCIRDLTPGRSSSPPSRRDAGRSRARQWPRARGRCARG